MNNPIKEVRVKATNKIIKVYRTLRGTWCDFQDCKTEYSKEDLDFRIIVLGNEK